MYRQSKPILSGPFKTKSRSNKGLDGISLIAIIALLLFICVSFWANMKMISLPSSESDYTDEQQRSSSSSSSSKQQQMSSLRKNLKPLLLQAYPTNTAADATNSNGEYLNTKLIEEWNSWAAAPMVGSYKFDGEATAILHNPYMELQSHYRNIRLGGNNSPFKMFHHNGGLPGPGPPGGPSSSSSMSTSNTPGTNDNNNQSALHLAKKQFPDPDGAALTRKGNKFMASGVKYNQDRVMMVSWPDSIDNDWWIGLFDGHGFYGHITSQYASYEFAKQLQQQQKQSSSSSSTESTLTAISDIFQNIQKSLPQIPDSGTTGISVWKKKDQLYISNIGDSTAFVAGYTFDNNKVGNIEIIYQTEPHKPASPEERKRIESMGGTVLDPQIPGDSSRILIPNEQNPELSMALAMSRSIGDIEGHKYGLSPIPTTKVLDLNTFKDKNNKHYIVVAASDGLVDRISPTEIATTFAQSFSASMSGDIGSSMLPLEAAEKLIIDSSHLWNTLSFGDGEGYRDDISVAVHRLRL